MLINARRLFTPLTLGSVTLPNRLVQGPLAGYSCAPFRVMTARYGQAGFSTTEMISAHDLAHASHTKHRYLWRDPEESLVCYQLSGQSPEFLARAVEKVNDAGADLIDLNCGCPVNKIRSKSCGSKLLATPEKIYALVKSIKENTDAAVSCKIRVGEPLYDSDDLAVAQAIESAGADFMIVHGRHWTERYDVPARFEPIARLKAAVTIPVFANGDVNSAEMAEKIMAITGCDGLMIARAGAGNPWLFAQIRAEVLGEPYTPPDRQTILQTFLEHVHRLSALQNEKLAVLQSRKLAKYYFKPFPDAAELTLAIQSLDTLAEVERICA